MSTIYVKYIAKALNLSTKMESHYDSSQVDPQTKEYKNHGEGPEGADGHHRVPQKHLRVTQKRQSWTEKSLFRCEKKR